MSEKSLTEQEWKKFAKGRTLKDAPLLKALAELDKARTPDARLAALDEIDKQADVLRKAGKADKDLAGVLDDMGKAASRERKLADADSRKAAESESDEDDAPDVLTSKLIPLLRQVRKGDVMQVLVAVGGKDSAVLLSRKAIGPPRRKLLTNYLGVSGGVKFVPGECLWEENACTFVVQMQAAGLAKKLKAALLQQTGQRYKVRVRGEDPNDIDDDGEPADDGDDVPAPPAQAATAGAQATAADPRQAECERRLAAAAARLQALAAADAVKPRAVLDFALGKARDGNWAVALQSLDSLDKLLSALAAAGSAQPAAAAPAASTAGAPPGPDAAQAFNARLAALMPHIKQTLGAAGPSAAAIRQAVADAGEAARGKRFDQAQAGLDAVERLLQAGTAPAGAAAAGTDGSSDRGDDGAPSLVKLQQARLVWDGLRKTVQRQLQALEQTMLAGVRAHNQADDAEFGFDEGAVADGVRRIYTILDRLDTRLIDTLDRALNASGAQREQLNASAMKLVDEYRSFVEGDPLIAAIDGNGFAATSIRGEARKALADLAAQL